MASEHRHRKVSSDESYDYCIGSCGARRARHYFPAGAPGPVVGEWEIHPRGNAPSPLAYVERDRDAGRLERFRIRHEVRWRSEDEREQARSFSDEVDSAMMVALRTAVPVVADVSPDDVVLMYERYESLDILVAVVKVMRIRDCSKEEAEGFLSSMVLVNSGGVMELVFTGNRVELKVRGSPTPGMQVPLPGDVRRQADDMLGVDTAGYPDTNFLND